MDSKKCTIANIITQYTSKIKKSPLDECTLGHPEAGCPRYRKPIFKF